MSPSTIKTLMQNMNDMYFSMERENYAMRKLLNKRGLSNAMIQRRVVALLKDEDYRQSALQRMHEVCEETLRRLPALDAQEILAEMKIEGLTH